MAFPGPSRTTFFQDFQEFPRTVGTLIASFRGTLIKPQYQTILNDSLKTANDIRFDGAQDKDMAWNPKSLPISLSIRLGLGQTAWIEIALIRTLVILNIYVHNTGLHIGGGTDIGSRLLKKQITTAIRSITSDINCHTYSKNYDKAQGFNHFGAMLFISYIFGMVRKHRLEEPTEKDSFVSNFYTNTRQQ